MPIDVVCPKCQSRLRAPDEVVGKNVRCKKCQEKFKVPNPGSPFDSVGDTQQLSVLEMPLSAMAKPKVAPASAEPIPLDDSAFDVPTPASSAPIAKLAVAVEDGHEDRPLKKKTRERPLIGGVPTFAMPGVSEDTLPIHVPRPVHASQFSFEESKPAPVEHEDDRPRPKSKTRDDDEEDHPHKPSAKKRGKSNKILHFLVGMVALLLLGGSGGGAAVYYFVLKTGDGLSKATLTVGTNPPSGESKPPVVALTPKLGPKSALASGPPVTPLTLPRAGQPNGIVVGAGTTTPLPFSADMVRQIQGFDHPASGPMLLAIYKSQLGFNGVGSEDTVVRFDIARKSADEFIAPADRVTGARVFDVSDSGDRVAIEAPRGRLTVYDFAKKTKLFDGYDIYAGLPEREGPVAIGFGDSTGKLVAVVDKFGAVDVWNLDERQRIVTGSPDPGKSPVAVGPRKRGGEIGLMAGKGWIKNVTWKNGQFSQKMNLPAKSGVPSAAAGQMEGGNPAQTAIVHMPEGSSDREILIVDKSSTDRPGSTAAAVWRIPLPATAGVPKTLRWVQGDRVLVLGFEEADGVMLMDIKEKTPAVYLKSGQEKTHLAPTGDLALMPDPKVPGKATLVRATIPVDAFNDLVATAKLDKVPGCVYFKPEGLNK